MHRGGQPHVYFAGSRSFGSSGTRLRVARGIHPSAVVDPFGAGSPSATVGPLCVVERGAVVGEGSVLTSRVTLGENCQVGARCRLLHPGWSSAQMVLALLPTRGLGQDRTAGGRCALVTMSKSAPTLASTVGALQDTVIEDGVKLDNLIQIGHNVRIGRHSAMAGCGWRAVQRWRPLHRGWRRHRAGAPGAGGQRARVGGNGGDPLAHAGRPVHGHVPHRRQCKWEKNAATLKQLHKSARAHQAL